MKRREIVRMAAVLSAVLFAGTLAFGGCGKKSGDKETASHAVVKEQVEGVDENGNPVLIELDENGDVVNVIPNGETVNAPTEREEETLPKPSNPVPETMEEGAVRVTNGAGEYILDINPNNLVIPGKDTLDDTQIKNYEVVDAVDEENREIVGEEVTIHSVGKYNGVYVEFGEDIYLENVAAMLVTNNSDRMLQVARFTMVVNDNPEDQALFQVTDLPAGATALIFELNKRAYNDGDVYTVGEEIHTFFENAEDRSKDFEVSIKDGVMVLKNLTDKKYEKVYVHYKYVQEGGCYLGGIAYRSGFTMVGPKEVVSTGAGHYTKKISQIVMIEAIEATEEPSSEN